ncbi:MAG: DUF2299 family protein [Candidatus Lokiarchaeota archaeon]|nr:DUF2299 family protein [Candidatus Lokiarchaeota archaeon]
MSDNDDVFLQIKKWCIEDRVFKLKLPGKEGFTWAVELSYPYKHPVPASIVILNPTDTDFIILQINMKMSPQHLEALTKKGPPALPIFYNQMQRMFLQKDVTFNIDRNQHAWIISEQIHFDGLSKNELFKAIRRIHNAMFLGNMIIDEVLQATFLPVGKKGSGSGGKEGSGMGGSFYQ